MACRAGRSADQESTRSRRDPPARRAGTVGRRVDESTKPTRRRSRPRRGRRIASPRLVDRERSPSPALGPAGGGRVAPRAPIGWSAWRSSSTRCARRARRTATRSSSTTDAVVPAPPKIGVVGPNGAASRPAQDHVGSTSRPTATRFLTPGYRRDPQQRHSTDQDVLATCRTAYAPSGQVDRFNEIAELMAQTTATSHGRDGKLQRDDHAARGLDRTRAGHGRAALPAPDADARALRGERAGSRCCRLMLSRSTCAARRATNHLDAESVPAGGAPGRKPRHRRRRHHDRTSSHVASDPRARTGRAYPTSAIHDHLRPAVRLKSRGRRTPAAQAPGRQLEWVRSERKGAGQEPHRLHLQESARLSASAARLRGDPDPPGPRRHLVFESTSSQGLRHRSHRRAVVSLPRNGIVGVIGPNGVGKTTLFRC